MREWQRWFHYQMMLAMELNHGPDLWKKIPFKQRLKFFNKTTLDALDSTFKGCKQEGLRVVK